MIAIGGVFDGSALEIEDEIAAAIIGGIGFIPLAIDRVPAIGQAINAVAVFEVAYDNINPKSKLVRKIVNTTC